jgi:hypothetical protein
MRKLVLTILALCAFGAVLASPASASWRSNNWMSPSGNIRCVFDDNRDAITCGTASPRRSVTLFADGHTGRGRFLPNSRGFVLGYGQTWQSHYSDASTTCWSSKRGMDCSNYYGGFTISRERITTNYYGNGDYDY